MNQLEAERQLRHGLHRPVLGQPVGYESTRSRKAIETYAPGVGGYVSIAFRLRVDSYPTG